MSCAITTDVAVIGAGPSGLAVATRLAATTDARVLVVEREAEAGGIPRHSDHPGYGIRDKRAVMSGPAYARRLVDEATDAGAEIRTSAMVTDWSESNGLEVTSPRGRDRIDAKAIVLATGARERPRAARMVPGSRPAGVLTTGELQNKIHLHHQQIGNRAVVVGAELVSWSAAMTLKEAGCATEALVTSHAVPESYGVFNIGGRVMFRTRVATRTRVVQILGRHRVTGVELENLDTGERRTVECDTVVFTGDWIPDNELARLRGIALDPCTKGPLVDALGRTDHPGVFAAGNLVHPVDTADVAALGGTHVAGAVAQFLSGGPMPTASTARILPGDGITWITPGVHGPGIPAPARGRLEAWVPTLVRLPRVTVMQDGRLLARRRLPWPASPGRVFRIPWTVLNHIDPQGGDVTVSL